MEINLAPFLLILSQISIVSSLSVQQQNDTLQLCCEPKEYFQMSRYKCERIPNGVDINWNLSINYINGTKKEVNIFKDFIYKINLPCEKPEALYWQMNETFDIDVATDHEFCFTPFNSDHRNYYSLVQLDCHLELHYFLAFKHEYIYLFSGVLLVPTLIVYIILKPLNDNLMGKCFICYLSSVIVTNSFYFIIPQMLLLKYRFPNLVYISIGLTHYYFNMALVYWLNVLGFDAWKHFSSSHEELNSFEKKRRFCFYSIYAWSMGALTTVPTVWRNFSIIFEYCNKYQQSKSCVMLTYGILYTDIYFAPAVMTILVLNFLIFCSVAWKIYKIRSKFADTIYNERFFKENLTICLRLFVLMGPQWIFMYFLKDYEFIEVLIISMNYIESVLIFILFVIRKNVLILLFKNKTIK